MRRILALIVIFAACSVAWMVLAGITRTRTYSQSGGMRDSVQQLWGTPQTQRAPTLTFEWQTTRLVEERREQDGQTVTVTRPVVETHRDLQQPDATVARADLRLDLRRKGLIWFPLYDLDFHGAWTYTHTRAEAGVLDLDFAFPNEAGVYDGFAFVVDEVPVEVQPEGGRVRHRLPVAPGQTVHLSVGYRTRGMNTWAYAPAQGVTRLQAFDVTMTTDFDAIDFPPQTLSPTEKAPMEQGGWQLRWRFDQVVTGFGLGMVAPSHVQPGELATELAASAPISLFFFFLVLFVLDTLRGINMHPLNYALLSGAFFAFHLLFAYSADHLPVEGAFALASVVSLALVVTYLRLVVGTRFAFVEAAGAQLVYLVGFSLAHFWEGFTGLTVTVLAVVTLFAVMQWTGRVDWSKALARPTPPRPAPPSGVAQASGAPLG